MVTSVNVERRSQFQAACAELARAGLITSQKPNAGILRGAIPAGDTPRLIARLATHYVELDGRTGKVVRKIEQIPHTHGAALSPDGATAFAIHPETGDVTSVPLTDN